MLQLRIPHSLDALPPRHVPRVELHHLPAHLIAQAQGVHQDALRVFVSQAHHLVPAVGWRGGRLSVRQADEMGLVQVKKAAPAVNVFTSLYFVYYNHHHCTHNHGNGPSRKKIKRANLQSGLPGHDGCDDAVLHSVRNAISLRSTFQANGSQNQQ